MHLEKIPGALLPRGIFIGLAGLHDFLQTLAFRSQLIHHIVLHLQSILEIIDHPLFDFLKLLDTVLIRNAHPLMLSCLFLLRVRDIDVEILPVDVLVFGCVSAMVQLMIALHYLLLLVAIFCLETLIGDIHALTL